jgi:hypothetical protein
MSSLKSASTYHEPATGVKRVVSFPACILLSFENAYRNANHDTPVTP